MSDDDKSFTAGLMDTGQALDYPDVFDDSTSNLFPALEDSELFNGMDILADCESHADDWTSSSVPSTLQLLSQAGIQQPAERQIRLHSELVQHLSTSADDSMFTRHDSMPVKASSSESELVRMLTSAVEDASSVTPLLPHYDKFDVDNLQHVPVMSMPSAEWLADIAATNSELVKQLSASVDNDDVAGSVLNTGRHHHHHHHHHQQQQQGQRVALVQPTVAHPSLKIDASQLIVHHQPQTAVSTASNIEQRQSGVTVHGVTVPVQSAVLAETTQPVQRHIVITTQAPVQAQQVQQISLQQLQQV